MATPTTPRELDRLLRERDWRIEEEVGRLLRLPPEVAEREIRHAIRRTHEISEERHRTSEHARMVFPTEEERRHNLTIAAAVQGRFVAC